ncbi:SNF2 domain-containing protein CLASSY 3-like [Andrographis paniculata]|uniref:SNF2 domain-containing protein CLASSY 3-like n=1 Tax=Andrographis paniculata TaxID=175694 RepID=UPI0021E7682B|nr:SNF2 domain-containing protein CLASSY 3-like [Andrographis paniculata]
MSSESTMRMNDGAIVITDELRNKISATIEHLFGSDSEMERGHVLDTTGSDDQPEMGDDLPNTTGFDYKVHGCTDGNHNLSYRGCQGLICTSCDHVELDACQVLRSWVHKACSDSFEEMDDLEGTEKCKMQPSKEELEEILEHLRSRAQTYTRIFGEECTVSELDCLSNEDNADSLSNTIVPLEERHEIDNLEGDSGDTISSSSADRPSNSMDSTEEVGIADDGIGRQVRSTRRINTHLSSIYVVGELCELSSDEDFTLRKRQKVNNGKRVDTPEDSVPVQRRMGTPKRKAAVNSPQRKTKQRRLSEICEVEEHRLELGGAVSVSKAQRGKAPRTSKNSRNGDDMPYWLEEMTKFMTGAKAKKMNPKRFDISKFLEESIFRPQSGTMHTGEGEDYPALPKKFRFEEDAVPLTEEEQREAQVAKEMEDLFDDMNFDLAVEEMGTTTSHEWMTRRKTPKSADVLRGLHELTSADDQGLYCIYCQHVAIHPRDVIPPWAIKTHRAPRKKKKQEKGERLNLGAMTLPVADAAEVSCRTRGSVWGIKAGVQETLYEHQREGFEFLLRNLAGSTDIADSKSSNLPGVGGCIISHAPGTGKTRLTLVFLETYLKMFPNCLPMIIVPATILGTWETEFRRWNAGFHFHNLNNPAFTGDERAAADHLFQGAKIRCRDTEAIRMVKIYSWKRGGGLSGISYNLFEKLTAQKGKEANAGEVGFLRSTLLEMPGLVILDEGHTPRNERTKIWASLVQVKTDKRIILSGTLFQNNFTELFNTVMIVRPTATEEIMQDRTFAEILHSDKKTHSPRSALLPEAVNRAVERLKVSMSPFVHVHKGTILQKNLPRLRDSVILLKPTGLQKKLIDILEGERLKRIITNEHGFSLASIHPYLIQKCKSQVPTDGIDMKAVEASKLNPFEGVKTKFILEFVRLCMTLKEKVLIFCQNLPPLELIKDHLAATFQWNASKEILRLEGKLPKKQRQRVIDAFNDPENDSKILLASTRCCSEGISLVGASRVILLDVVWNPSVEQQAISRAYRIGQKKVVHSYHLMTVGTLEADKYCRQAEKERLSELVFCSSSNEKDISKQPMPEIKDKILQEMVQHAKTKDIFEKIIHQPKNADLSQSLRGRG